MNSSAGFEAGDRRRFDSCQVVNTCSLVVERPHFLSVLSARLDGLPWKQEDVGSNPTTQTRFKPF